MGQIDTSGTGADLMILPFVADLTTHPDVVPFVDAATNTISYIVHDPASRSCSVIDPVMDYDSSSGRVTFENADAIIGRIRDNRWVLQWLVETHVHPDHLSAAAYIQQQLGGRRGIGEKIRIVQNTIGTILGEGSDLLRDGSQFDRLFGDGDSYTIGSISARVIETPGNTPDSTTHVIGDAAFVGVTLLMPDSGSGRTDLPGGDAATLYRSIRRILRLPNQTRVFVGHDHGAGGRAISWETSVRDERMRNVLARDGIDAETFVARRHALDKTLAVPKLIIPSLQVNIRGGRLPSPGEDQRVFLKLPINAF